MPTTQNWITLSEAAQQLQLPAKFLEKLANEDDSEFGGAVLPTRLIDGHRMVNRKVLDLLQNDILDHHHWAVEEALTTQNSLNAGCAIHKIEKGCTTRQLSREEIYEQELYLLEDPQVRDWYPHLFTGR